MTMENQGPGTVLPVTNEYGYYEIRLESIGGLGANLCGKMLGELGALSLSCRTAPSHIPTFSVFSMRD